jgi:peptidoglycan/LPS O-acetylase OafA/YrhL
MRGICALIVAILHCDIVLGSAALFRHGWLSVDIFFVMSGFAIALSYEDRLQRAGGFGAFVRARAARLLPVQIIGTIIAALSCLALYWSGHWTLPGLDSGVLLVTLVWGLFLIPINLSPVAGIFAPLQWGFPIDPPLWSLHAELIVNILYGRFLFATRTFVLAAIFGGLTIYLLYHLLHVRPEWDMTVPYKIVPNLARAIIGFLAGMMIFRANKAGLLHRLPLIPPQRFICAGFSSAPCPMITQCRSSRLWLLWCLRLWRSCCWCAAKGRCASPILCWGRSPIRFMCLTSRS